jgi:hypothetical protein
MTHDELLAEIDRLDLVLEDSYGIKALRAVVELHKPSPIYLLIQDIGCVGCGYNVDYSVWNEAYPCRTIQAIEKELA